MNFHPMNWRRSVNVCDIIKIKNEDLGTGIILELKKCELESITAVRVLWSDGWTGWLFDMGDLEMISCAETDDELMWKVWGDQ